MRRSCKTDVMVHFEHTSKAKKKSKKGLSTNNKRNQKLDEPFTCSTMVSSRRLGCFTSPAVAKLTNQEFLSGIELLTLDQRDWILIERYGEASCQVGVVSQIDE